MKVENEKTVIPFNYLGMENVGYVIVGQIPKLWADATMEQMYPDVCFVIGKRIKKYNPHDTIEWVVWEAHVEEFRGFWSGDYCNTYKEVSTSLKRRGGIL